MVIQGSVGQGSSSDSRQMATANRGGATTEAEGEVNTAGAAASDRRSGCEAGGCWRTVHVVVVVDAGRFDPASKVGDEAGDARTGRARS